MRSPLASGSSPSKGEAARRTSTKSTDYLKVPQAGSHMRIGLFGGSFNPPHEAHRRVSLAALSRLGLDQVWWLVSPANPLKADRTFPPLKQRVEAARQAAHHPKIVVTGFEGASGSPYTIDTIRFLKRRFPAVKFVWLMGADNLASFHRWRAFEEIFQLVPIAVFDRPGFRLKGLAGQAAQRFSFARVDESDARGLADLEPPAWAMITLPLSGLSSTRLRAEERATQTEPAKDVEVKQRKVAKAKADRKAAKQARKVAKKETKKAIKEASKRTKRPPKAVKQAAKALKKAVKKASVASKQSNKKAK